MDDILKLSELKIKNRVFNGIKEAIKRVNEKDEKINDIIKVHIYLKLHKEEVPDVIDDKLKQDADEFFKHVEKMKLKKGDDELNDKINSIKQSPNLLKKLQISPDDKERNDAIIDDIESIRNYQKIKGNFKALSPIIKFHTGDETLAGYNAVIEEIGKYKAKEEGKREAEEEGEKITQEKLRELKKERDAKMHTALAEQKNKLEERLERIEQNQFQPSMREYIKNKVRDGSYKLDKDDLHMMISKDKNKGLITDENIDDVVKAIYLEGNKHVIKNKRRIAQLARMQGYNPNEYAKLPEETQKEVNDYIVEKFNDDLRKKNLKYILPKDKPRWQRAQVLFKLNPNLGKGAWSH